ncbi:glycosyltransferase involved in cell wall biosynthesis [Kitasatospora sp. MAP12-15]|uniref:glycosyltransferase family 2 protein n=1 Tax=unclassified Kitasatospora TaxID=2633591 RepID=UPI0024771242|nr:glycosyltransferase family A protein [Kitasatospora sp. MAP12-44]MDH6108276.1 glycosyltransferase involved in cell wall biosynthesis [Kitasatospora sp. MAP12-44]
MADDSAPVSVVIAAYDAERTLGAAVASALRQVPRPAQVIVVDDGSRDGTAEVAASFPDVLLLRQQNQGPSAARNTGIQAASQPWVAFLDADDVWLPGKLARQLAAWERHPTTVLLAGDWVRAEPGEGAAPPVGAGADAPETLLGYRELLVLNRFQTSTVLVRSDVLARCGGFDPGLDGAEDWDLWLRCVKSGPAVKLDVPLVVYRDEPTGYSKDLPRLYRRMLAMLSRERSGTTLSATAFAQVVAWHHLRFALAFLLAGQPERTRGVLRELRVAGLARHVPAAAVRYLAPFLGGRVLRRLRRS